MSDRFSLRELSRYPLGTFADIIYRNALLYADDDAFVYGPKKLSFSQFNAQVNSLIHALQKMGIKKGDVLGILSWNCIETAEVHGAAMKGGFIASPFNPRAREDELVYIINYSEATILFVGNEMEEITEQLRSRIPTVKHIVSFENSISSMDSYCDILSEGSQEEPDIQVEEEDPFIIYYTSGTSGKPRGALYIHQQRILDTCLRALQVGMEPRDRHLMILPLFHIGGSSHFWTFYFMGGCNIFLSERRFDPVATLEAIRSEAITDVHIVPTQLVAILSLPDLKSYHFSSLKRILYAASPMPVEILKKGIEIFGPIFMQLYGQSESGPDITFLSAKDHLVINQSPEEQKILSSSGRPCLWAHVRIVDQNDKDVKQGDVGEIVVQSKKVMKEYWRKPEETREVMAGGWLHTGDLGYCDEKGYIYIVDRKKDMIITGGENVYPREVEEILYRHPSIQEVAVLGIPHPFWVESVHALVVLKGGHHPGEQEIIEFCKHHLAGYKAPKSVEFVDSLPKNPQGKILKKEIRAKYRSNR